MLKQSMAVIALLTLAACTSDQPAGEQAETPAPEAAAGQPAADSATAVLRDASGREVGTIAIGEGDGGIKLSGTVRGIAPGTHGIHLHMTGQCQAPFETAGGHWNPDGKQHGFLSPQGPHRGDLPNLTVTEDSTGLVQLVTRGGTLRGADGLLDADGAAVVIHAKEDDEKTDPSGNSGDRIVCGVIS